MLLVLFPAFLRIIVVVVALRRGAAAVGVRPLQVRHVVTRRRALLLVVGRVFQAGHAGRAQHQRRQRRREVGRDRRRRVVRVDALRRARQGRHGRQHGSPIAEVVQRHVFRMVYVGAKFV